MRLAYDLAAPGQERRIADRNTSFDRRFADPPSVAIVRKLLIALIVVHVPLALWSGYRAIVQVQRLELSAPGTVLHNGSTIQVGVVSSGRATVDVWLEMIQGARAETLGVRRVPTGGITIAPPRTISSPSGSG